MQPETLTGVLGSYTTGRLVLGEPLTVQNTTLVPVISVSAGYASIGGGNGGGGGFSLTPVAIVACGDNGLQVYTLQPQVEAECISAVISDMFTGRDRGTADAGGH